MNFIYQKLSILVLLILFYINFVNANTFIAKENNHIIVQSGDINLPHSPFSTFKILLALIGFESEILTSPTSPLVLFTLEIDQKYVTFYDPDKHPKMQMWKKNHTPETWMKYSVVWFSRYITHQLSMEKFTYYVNLLNYGNLNVLGDETKENDGLMNAWLGSSLKITPLQQLEFIEKLASKKLPITINAQNNTIAIMEDGDVFNGWKLYGKTGGTMNQGWFVGWIQKDDQRVTFVQFVEQTEEESRHTNQPCGLIARTHALQALSMLV